MQVVWWILETWNLIFKWHPTLLKGCSEKAVVPLHREAVLWTSLLEKNVHLSLPVIWVTNQSPSLDKTYNQNWKTVSDFQRSASESHNLISFSLLLLYFWSFFLQWSFEVFFITFLKNVIKSKNRNIIYIDIYLIIITKAILSIFQQQYWRHCHVSTSNLNLNFY